MDDRLPASTRLIQPGTDANSGPKAEQGKLSEDSSLKIHEFWSSSVQKSRSVLVGDGFHAWAEAKSSALASVHKSVFSGKICNNKNALYHKQIENFVNWCGRNYLYLNVSE